MNKLQELNQDMLMYKDINAEDLYRRIRTLHTYYVLDQEIFTRINFKIYVVKILLQMFPYMGLLDANRIVDNSIT